MNIKELKNIIKDLPDETEVYYERIEDIYFNKHWWKADYLYNDPEFPWTSNEYIKSFCGFNSEWKLCITAHY